MSQIPPQIPLPVMPMSFVGPSTYQRRPGIVTGLGAASIIIAVLTAIGCFVVIIWSFVMLANTPRAAAPAPVSSVATPVPGKIAVPQEDSLSGLSPKKRNVVMLGLTRARSLSPKRIRQMDALLARSGRLMFPIATQNVDAKIVRSNVSDSGLLPSSKGPSAGDGPNFYIIGTGKIEIYDDHAVFRPTGSSDVVSVNADEAGQDQEDQAAAPFMPAAPMSTVIVKEEKPLALFLLFEALVSGALAIYLFVVGILVLRNSLVGRKLHWIYIRIKIPVAVLAVAATARLWWAYGDAARLNPTASFGGEEGMAMAVLIAAILGLFYPVALMMVLKSRGVVDYYVQAKEDALARGA